MRDRVLSAYRDAGIDYYVDFGPGWGQVKVMKEVVRENPGAFLLRYETPRRTARIYELRLGRF